MALSPEFIEQLEAAALLPDADSQRQTVLAAISQYGPEARQYWLDLLRANERLRLDLLHLPMPAGLADKLLAVPDAMPARADAARWNRLRNVAAILILVAGLAYLIYPKIRDYRLERWQNAQFDELTIWAVENHISTPAGAVASEDRAVITNILAGAHMPIATPIFEATDGGKLVGGGTTQLHDKPVVFTKWVSGDQHYTLFEFMPEQFGLSPSFDSRMETPEKLWSGNKQYAVVIWSQERFRCGWLLVKDTVDAPLPYKVQY